MGMPSNTPLREHLDATRQTAEAFAAAHGLSPWSVRHWARGDKHPELDSQIKLGEATAGIAGPEKWLAWKLENAPDADTSGIAA